MTDILSNHEEHEEHEENVSSNQARSLLPLRNIVVFPHMIVTLFVGRGKSIRALEEVMRSRKDIVLAAQKDADDDDPKPEGIYTTGVLASVLQMLKLPDGTVKVVVEGVKRIVITSFVERVEFFEVIGSEFEELEGNQIEAEALSRLIADEFENYAKLNKKIPPETNEIITQIEDHSRLADLVASHLVVKVAQKQEILQINDVNARLEKILELMQKEISVLQVGKRIRSRVKRQMEKTQREYYLNEQMKAIQNELGDSDSGRDELGELEAKIKKVKLSPEAKEKALGELKKLRQMSPMSAEATVVRNYLDWLVAIPWSVKSRQKANLTYARSVLDADHYGLDKVKERIIEYLAVQKRTQSLRGPILCLVGPPGVGKTSLGRSIARATGREFVRLSLGGVRDEAEIRGHRRTYIGSMPGKIIQSMRKAKKVNPLFLLDEIDKMGVDFRGDPSSALLEVLDPEQNNTFNDHYLEVDYDLSNVMFVTTANSLNIPLPLLDRIEIIRIAGYTEYEKVEIAKRHLVKTVTQDHGLKDDEWAINDSAIRSIIRYYTREAGVRGLKRELAKLARKVVTLLLTDKDQTKIALTAKGLEKFLGVPRYRFGMAEEFNQIGVVTGLAWTEVGGELLTIEGAVIPGKGKMTVTGNLKDVMKESISAATAYVRSRSIQFGIAPTLFERRDIHVHVPEAATPKDGPSAGIAMAAVVVSIMTKIPIHRNIAMTGEVTLRGRVLEIGGLKEKLLAALRGGIKRVLIPKDNLKDLSEIPDNVKQGLEIIGVSHMDEVLMHALEYMPEPIEWPEDDQFDLAASKKPNKGLSPGVTAH